MRGGLPALPRPGRVAARRICKTRQQPTTAAGGVGGEARRVRVQQSPTGAAYCGVLPHFGGPLFASACSDEERELLSTQPPAWAMRSLLFFPFPMRLGEATDAESLELGCLA